MDRANPYETAFEGYLQWHRLCYVAVDETRRCYLGEDYVKNLDFIVHGEAGARLLVDVKGRRFPTGPAGKERRVWECWSTQEDVSGLSRWAELFGPGYQGLLVFTYHLLPSVVLAEDTDDLWTWRGRRYLLRAVPVDAYRRHLRVRSPKWGTVGLPNEAYRKLARPFRYYSHECPAPREAEEIDGPDQARHLSEITRAALQAFVAGGAEAWRGRGRAGGGGRAAAPKSDADGPT